MFDKLFSALNKLSIGTYVAKQLIPASKRDSTLGKWVDPTILITGRNKGHARPQ